MLTTGNQLKAARSLIGMDQGELSSLAGVNINTIRNMEGVGPGQIAGRAQNVQAVQRVLEREGVEFLNHGKPGVRLSGEARPRPRLFRRDAIEDRHWVAFAVDYAGARRNGFVTYDALGVSPSRQNAAELFDERRAEILAVAAERIDQNMLDPQGHVLINELPVAE